jgi:hypothetical protein
MHPWGFQKSCNIYGSFQAAFHCYFWNIKSGEKYLKTLQKHLYLSLQPSHVPHSPMVSFYHDVCVQQMWVQQWQWWCLSYVCVCVFVFCYFQFNFGPSSEISLSYGLKHELKQNCVLHCEHLNLVLISLFSMVRTWNLISLLWVFAYHVIHQVWPVGWQEFIFWVAPLSLVPNPCNSELLMW